MTGVVGTEPRLMSHDRCGDTVRPPPHFRSGHGPQSLSLLKGHPVVLNFWASWCGPCVEEMPSLSALHREYAKKGIEFVGLGVDSDKNVKNFLQKVRVDYPVYVIGFGGADLARAFGNSAGALPFTVVIDAKGVVRSTKLGQIQPGELKATLDAL